MRSRADSTSVFASSALLTIVGSFFVDEGLDLIASIVDDAIDAEVEIGGIRSEELLKEGL